MKKLRRFILLFLLSGLMITLSNIILARLSVAAAETGDTIDSTAINSQLSQTITGQNSLAIKPIDGLTVTHSSPAVAGFPVFFTATITSTPGPPAIKELHNSALSIFYIWSFGDGSPPEPSTQPTISHIYTMPATYTVVVTAIDSFDADVATQTVSVVVSRPEQQFLPVVFKNFTPPELPADLRCTLTINPPTPSSGQPVLITVEINNQGEGSADGFWVDLYINPASPPIPGRSNRIRWEDACGGPSSCQRGIAWRISNNPLFPPNSRTLISIPADLNPTGGQGFDRNNSNWPSGILPAGVYNFYAYVDSINGENVTIDGAVREVNESNNRCGGNLVVPASVSAETDEAGSSNLPQRPTPP